jgi:hypothetical protein
VARLEIVRRHLVIIIEKLEALSFFTVLSFLSSSIQLQNSADVNLSELLPLGNIEDSL